MAAADIGNEGTQFDLRPAHDLPTLEGAWRALDHVGVHSFFASWVWAGSLLRSLPSCNEPMVLEARRAGTTVGLALVGRRRAAFHHVLPVHQLWLNATGEPRFDCMFIEHNGIATAGSASLWPALLEWFAAMPEDELIVPGVGSDAADLPSSVHVDRARTGYRIPLRPVAASALEAMLSRNARQQLRRSFRDYATPLAFDIAKDADTAQAYFSGLKDLHVRSWTRRGRQHAFAEPFFEKFHRALIATGVPEGSVDLVRVSSSEAVVGYLYNFRRNGTVYAYQSGFDDGTPGLRPGYVCHALAIEHYAAAGETYYDFLAGTNRLKETFGTEHYELSWRHYRKPRAGFRAEALARTAATLFKRVRG